MGRLRDTTHYKILMQNDMQNDLEYCLKRDILRVLPMFRDGIITV